MPPKLCFQLSGEIADIDESTSDESPGPVTVLLIEIGQDYFRVLVPEAVMQDRRALLCVGRPVKVLGELRKLVAQPVHVATDLRLVGPTH